MTTLRGCGIAAWALMSAVLGGRMLAVTEAYGARNYHGVATSTRIPPAITQLPILGRIQWTGDSIPHVRPGPSGGISGAGMVAHKGKIYLMGGFIPFGDGDEDARGKPGSHRTSRWGHRYDPQTKQWTRLPDMPGRREYTRAIVAGESIYVAGGACQFKGEEVPYRPLADCFRLDLSRDPPVWTKHSQLTVPRTHTAVGLIGENLLVVAGGNEYDFGVKGYHKSTIRDTVDIFDLSRPAGGWQQRVPLPGPRGWVASSVCGGKLYVLGGLTFSESNTQHRHRETFCYDAEKDAWDTRAPFPLPISGWEAAAYRERFIIAVGGVMLPEDHPVQDYTFDLIKHTRWNDVAFVYDTLDDRWYRLEGALPPGGKFNDPGVCIIGDTIYVAGAEGPVGGHWNFFLNGRIQLTPDTR